jgi:hypothetical protein
MPSACPRLRVPKNVPVGLRLMSSEKTVYSENARPDHFPGRRFSFFFIQNTKSADSSHPAIKYSMH